MNKLKKIREEKELTQEKMARKLNIDLRRYQNLEYGKNKKSILLAEKVASLLNVKIEDIWPKN